MVPGNLQFSQVIPDPYRGLKITIYNLADRNQFYPRLRGWAGKYLLI